MDGATDVKYLKRASELLNQETLLGKVEPRDGGGCGKLKKIWNTLPVLAEVITQKIVLLHDCDDKVPPGDKGNLIRQTIPKQCDHPIKKGIENLFGKAVLPGPEIVGQRQDFTPDHAELAARLFNESGRRQ